MKTAAMSGPDYYWILGLPRNATHHDICQAYRKLALQWHPNRNLSNRIEAQMRFREISEAFEVLSNREWRMLYDKYGRQGLLDIEDVGMYLDGLELPIPGLKTKERMFFRNPDDVFLEFFGHRDPDEERQHRPRRVVSGIYVYDEHGFENSFPGFTRPDRPVQLPHIPSAPGQVTWFKGSVFSGPTDSGDYRTVAESTKIVDGRQIVTRRDKLNDRELVIIEEDGVVKSKTINGQPC